MCDLLNNLLGKRSCRNGALKNLRGGIWAGVGEGQAKKNAAGRFLQENVERRAGQQGKQTHLI